MSIKPEDIFADLVKQLPSELDEEFIFTSDNLPELPEELETDKLAIVLSHTEHHSYTVNLVDKLDFFFHKSYSPFLGLLFLSKVFHKTPKRVALLLSHPGSHIKKLLLDFNEHTWGSTVLHRYYTRPERFHYIPGYVSEVPIGGRYLEIGNSKTWDYPVDKNYKYLPILAVEGSHQFERDTIHGAGSEFGNILFGKLLLDVALSEDDLDMVRLETEYSDGGVGFGSAAVRLIFPNNSRWPMIADNAEGIPHTDSE